MYPSIREKWSGKYHYIHVDEFQDVDKEQYKLIKYLSTVHDNIYVVGDPVLRRTGPKGVSAVSSRRSST